MDPSASGKIAADGAVAEDSDRTRRVELLAVVSGSAHSRAFWERSLRQMAPGFDVRQTLSLHEDLPVNQAFGLLLTWDRLRGHLGPGQTALTAFVFGEGTRATPMTETDNGQKPAILTYVFERDGERNRPLSMVELALSHFAPIADFLTRSGFDGMVVKWGDEVLVPECDLSGVDSAFRDADVVRFVSRCEVTAENAANKDFLAVDRDGQVKAFIPRRPIEQMYELAQRGWVDREGTRLFASVNLGSIAVSRRLLDALLAEFRTEIFDAEARRDQRPDLDPQFFTALCTAVCSRDFEARLEAWASQIAESPAMACLDRTLPDLFGRICRVVDAIAAKEHRPVRVRALDLGRPYWGDIGTHGSMYEFYMALLDRGARGRTARQLAGLSGQVDERGNLYLGRCHIAPTVTVHDSVLIDAVLLGHGRISRSVLVGTHAWDIEAEDAFDVMSTVGSLTLAPRAGSYRVIAQGPVSASPGQRLTTLFLSEGPVLMRVNEDTDLRNRSAFYDQPVLGNPLSFADAHARMSSLGPDDVARRTEQVRRAVIASFPERR